MQEILQTRILEWVAIPFPGCFPNPGTEPGSPALQADSFPSKPPGKRQGSRFIFILFSLAVFDMYTACW